VLPRRRSGAIANSEKGQSMKAAISTPIAVLALVAALAGLAAPSAAQEWYSARTASELPVGSTPWWQAMDREGRGGNGSN
jgi:hypothetical protein